MAEFHFIRPYFLLLIIPAIYFCWAFIRRKHKKNAWTSVVDAHLLNYLLIDQGQSKRRSLIILVLLAWLVAIFALAGPSWQKQQQPVYRSHQAHVIVLDLSQAMNAADIQPSRLTRAKYKVRDMLNHREEGQTALVVFTSEPYVVSPLTEDAATLAAFVTEVNTSIMPVQGHNISAALKKAGDLIKQANYKKGDILLITANAANLRDINEAKNLAAEGIHTSVLAVATKTGAPIPSTQGFVQDNNQHVAIHKLDSASLQQLAQAGQGKLVEFTHNNQDIEQLLQQASTGLNDVTPQSEHSIDLWKDMGGYFIVLVLMIALLAFRRGQIEEFD